MASYSAVEALLRATPEIGSVPGLPEKLAVLRARMGEINRLATTQTQPLLPSMRERDLVLDEMADMALEIAGLVTTLARDTKVPQLADAVEVGRSSFRRARPGHRLWFAQRVLDTAQSVLTELAPYGVTQETLDAYKARIDEARVGINLPRSTVVDKKTATRQLADLFTEVDELLDDQIDRLVFRLRKQQPAFYSRYRETRAIVDRRGSRRVSEGGFTTPATAPRTTPIATAPAAVTAEMPSTASDQRAA